MLFNFNIVGFTAPIYIHANIISELSGYFIVSNFDITYCSDMSRLYLSYVHGNLISLTSGNALYSLTLTVQWYEWALQLLRPCQYYLGALRILIVFNFNSTYCSTISRLYSSNVHGNVISELLEYFIFFNFNSITVVIWAGSMAPLSMAMLSLSSHNTLYSLVWQYLL